MVSQIGRSMDASTKDHREDVGGDEVPSFRYNNPGAQYPSERAATFGQTGYGIIGGGHRIARFPSPVNGAAANFDLLLRKYVGMAIGAAGIKWTGAHDFGVPRYPPDVILTQEMIEKPALAIPFLKAIAHRESGKGNNLTEEQWRQAHAMFKTGSADAYLDGLPSLPTVDASPVTGPSGGGMLKRAREHLGEKYVNCLVPKNDPNWRGPWDCAEFISWLVYQETGKLYGCVDDGAPPATAEAYTGAWRKDLERLGKRVSVEEAAATVGGIVLRYPPTVGEKRMGHIAICDGNGGTVEAKGERYGVIADTVHGRPWDTGVLIPGISYNSVSPIKVVPPAAVYAVDAPNMDPAIVKSIQAALTAKGFDPGIVDGEFGLNTQAAVLQFQQPMGLVVDGEVGPETASALGISLTSTPTIPSKPKSETGTSPEVASLGMQQLFALLLMALSREIKMPAYTAKQPAQLTDVLLLLMLQSMLGGKQLDLSQIAANAAPAKPVASSESETIPAAVVQPQPQRSAVSAAVTPPTAPVAPSLDDPFALIAAILYQRLTGKQWPLSSDGKVEAPATTPTTLASSVASRTSVQLSVGVLGIVTILQALGVIHLPFNIEALTGTGAPAGAAAAPAGILTAAASPSTLATLIPLIVGAVGATNGWSALAGVGLKLFEGIVAAFKPKT